MGQHRDGTPHTISQLVLDPDKAPLVRKAFEMRAAGRTYAEIHAVTHLHKSNLAYREMFQRRVYTGTYISQGEPLPDFCPPIVDLSTWQAVQRVSQSWRERLGPRRSTSSYLLSGLLVCPTCGHKMKGHTVQKWRYYTCNNPIWVEKTRCPGQHIPTADLVTLSL